MPRNRRVDLNIEPDIFGFDYVGADFSTSSTERAALIGLSHIAIALYYTCLKPFAKGDGRVYAASYYRLCQILTHRRRHGRGTLQDAPTPKVVRGAIEDLEGASLVLRPKVDNAAKGVLQIWLVHGVGGTAPDSYRAGNGAGYKIQRTRAHA